ncbi:hypothetical protein LIER_04192 [Lithospermum erythrorhizon]|uniref:Uncharacterized protein n=1 Tax=Lithospermum erythrorhizon TaxID=34254 RepID=A0AAV3NYM7_LITER
MDFARQEAIHLEADKPKEEPKAPKAARPSQPSREEEIVEALNRLMLRLTQTGKVASMTLKSFGTPVQGPKIKHGTMNPKTYDLLVKGSTAGPGYIPNPPLRILIKRVVDQPQVLTTKTPPDEQILYHENATPRKWGAVPWVYSTEPGKREMDAKRLKARGHRQSTHSFKQPPTQQWRMVQARPATKKETDS